MITSTFSFAEVLAVALLFAHLSGCSNRDEVQASSGETKSSSGPAVPKSPADGPTSRLLSTLQKNFDQATRGGPAFQNRMAKMPDNTSAGLICSPARLSKDSPNFRVVLPPRSEDRKGALAVIVPDGSMRIIYTSYGVDTDAEDLIIPSKAIAWESARHRNSFDVNALSFDALVPNESKPKPLFREKGIYQFALMNSIARDLLDFDKHPFWVIGGCVIHWQG